MRYHQNVVHYEGIDGRSWIALADTAKANHDLPLALALVHRDVSPMDFERWSKIRGPRDFAYSVSGNGQDCWSRLVWGYDCPYINDLHLDHAWPFALGGRSTPDNGVWLCEIHNRAKSDDVHAYRWQADPWPSWLALFTERLSAEAKDLL